MAKTEKNADATGRQAPGEVWSAEQVREALFRGTWEKKLETMRRAGIIDGQNQPVRVKHEKGWVTRAADHQPK